MKNKIFFLILFVHIMAWFALKPVWPFSDDYCYAYHASTISASEFQHTDNVFQNRFGVIVPVSGLFYLFGINPYSISLWPLLASLLTITILFVLVSRIADEKVALISCFLVSINLTQITYSIALFPDIFIELYSMACILILYYGREQKSNQKAFPFLFIVCLFLGILTKETSMLILPFIVFILIVDIIKKQHYNFWKYSFLLGSIFLGIYLLMFYFLTGDFFYKLKTTFEYNSNRLYDPQINENFIFSHSENILQWLNGDLGLIFLVLFSISTLMTIKKFDISDFKVFIALYSFLLLVILITLFYTNKYGMLFMMDRIWMLCIPPLCILTAYSTMERNKNSLLVLILLFLILTAYNFYAMDYKRGLLFTLFLVTLISVYYTNYKYKEVQHSPLLRRGAGGEVRKSNLLSIYYLHYFIEKNRKWNTILLLPFFLLTIRFVWANSNYRVGLTVTSNEIKNQIEELNSSGKKTIFTDDYFAENHIIYNDFKEYPNLLFYPFSSYDSLNEVSNLFVIINTKAVVIPDFISGNPEKWETKYDSGRLLIYKKRD